MMEVMQVTRCIAVATAAARSASDGQPFIERIREETGIEIEIISGEREAYLGYLGVKIDDERNNVRGEERLISTDDSKVQVYLLPTNEELAIARDTLKLTK